MNSQHINSIKGPNIHIPLLVPFDATQRVHQCPHCNCFIDKQYADSPRKSYVKTGAFVKDIYFDRVADRSQNSSRTNSNSNKHSFLEGTNVYNLQRMPFPPVRALSPVNRATKVNIRFVSPQPPLINNFTMETRINNSEEPLKPKVLRKKCKTPASKEISRNTNKQGQTCAHSGYRQSFANTNKLHPNVSPRQNSPVAFEYTPIKPGINKNASKGRLETIELQTTE